MSLSDFPNVPWIRGAEVQHSSQPLLNTAVVFCPYVTRRSKVVGWAGVQRWMDLMGKGLALKSMGC